MAVFQSKLLKKQEVAKDTMAFYFEKPQDMTYIPGQHASVLLVNPTETDEEGNKRTFSFITIPSDSEIAFTTRLRDTAFKRYLKNAPEGTPVEIKDPRGSLILPQDTSRSVVFLAGGIGITPFLSMVKQAAHENSSQKIYLFYANRTKEEAPFLDELNQLAEQNPNFVFIPVFTQEMGHITKEMLEQHLPTLSNTIFYLAGPLGLVEGLSQVLTQAGVDLLFIKSEDFGEYKEFK